jgi:hypothetical protein
MDKKISDLNPAAGLTPSNQVEVIDFVPDNLRATIQQIHDVIGSLNASGVLDKIDVVGVVPDATGVAVSATIQKLLDAINVLNATATANLADKLALIQGGVAVSATPQKLYDLIDSLTNAGALLGTYTIPLGVSGTGKNTDISTLSAFIAANLPFLNLSGSAYVIIGGSTNSATNGTNLVAAYAAAKLATPHGNALSAGNRFTIFLLPGVYAVGDGALVMDTSFIDIVGLSTNAGSSFITTGYSYGNTVISSAGNAVSVSAADFSLQNLTLITTTLGKYAYNPTQTTRPNEILINLFLDNTAANGAAMAPNMSFNGIYVDVRCHTPEAFANDASAASGAVANGLFIRCKASSSSFGAQGNASAGGIFVDCEADANSFGRVAAGGVFLRCRYVNIIGTAAGLFGYAGTAAGTFYECDAGARGGFGSTGAGGKFYNCRTSGTGFLSTANGIYENCIATGTNSFGGGGNTASGTFRRCVGGNGSFGGSTNNGGTASGVFEFCSGGDNSFGGGSNAGGTASGSFFCCSGGTHCFGSSGGTAGTLSGKLLSCKMSGHMRVTLSGLIQSMLIEAVAADTTALQLANGSTGKVYNCTILGTGTGTSIGVISGTSTISIAHCRMNKGIGAGVTNAINIPFNADEANGSPLTLTQLVLTPSSLTYAATTDIDFNLNLYRTITLTGDVIFTTSNRGSGKVVTLIITCDATPRNFTFPSWVFVGGSAPTSIAASKKAALSLTCLGANDTDIIAAYSVQP